MDDNLNLTGGVSAKSDAELVEKMVRVMKEFGFEPDSSAEAKEVLSLAK